MTVGWFAAHWLSYRIVIPDPTERARVLAASGHQYFSYVPLILAGVLSLLVAAFVAQAARFARGARPAHPVAWPFGLLPPLVFAFEEYFDRLVHDGTISLGTATEKTFVVGVLIQVPVGLVAFLVVRLLLRWADRLGQALARLHEQPPVAALVPDCSLPVEEFDRPRLSVFASGAVDRGPPAIAAIVAVA